MRHKLEGKWLPMSKNTTSANVIGRARGPRGIGGPVEKAKDRKGTLIRIWRYMEKQKQALILSMIFVIISTLLGLAAPYLIGVIIDDYIIPKDVSGAIRFILITCYYLLYQCPFYMAANVYDGSSIASNDSSFTSGFI